MRGFLRVLVATYQSSVALIFGGACRFEPSCSAYADEAFRTLPLSRALRLVAARILRCRPGGPWGFDPVPHDRCCDRRTT